MTSKVINIGHRRGKLENPRILTTVTDDCQRSIQRWWHFWKICMTWIIKNRNKIWPFMRIPGFFFSFLLEKGYFKFVLGRGDPGVCAKSATRWRRTPLDTSVPPTIPLTTRVLLFELLCWLPRFMVMCSWLVRALPEMDKPHCFVAASRKTDHLNYFLFDLLPSLLWGPVPTGWFVSPRLSQHCSKLHTFRIVKQVSRENVSLATAAKTGTRPNAPKSQCN